MKEKCQLEKNGMELQHPGTHLVWWGGGYHRRNRNWPSSSAILMHAVVSREFGWRTAYTEQSHRPVFAQIRLINTEIQVWCLLIKKISHFNSCKKMVLVPVLVKLELSFFLADMRLSTSCLSRLASQVRPNLLIFCGGVERAEVQVWRYVYLLCPHQKFHFISLDLRTEILALPCM